MGDDAEAGAEFLAEGLEDLGCLVRTAVVDDDDFEFGGKGDQQAVGVADEGRNGGASLKAGKKTERPAARRSLSMGGAVGAERLGIMDGLPRNREWLGRRAGKSGVGRSPAAGKDDGDGVVGKR